MWCSSLVPDVFDQAVRVLSPLGGAQPLGSRQPRVPLRCTRGDSNSALRAEFPVDCKVKSFVQTFTGCLGVLSGVWTNMDTHGPARIRCGYPPAHWQRIKMRPSSRNASRGSGRRARQRLHLAFPLDRVPHNPSNGLWAFVLRSSLGGLTGGGWCRRCRDRRSQGARFRIRVVDWLPLREKQANIAATLVWAPRSPQLVLRKCLERDSWAHLRLASMDTQDANAVQWFVHPCIRFTSRFFARRFLRNRLAVGSSVVR